MSTPSLLQQAQAQLAESLAAVPEGHRGALAVVVTTEGARVALAGKVGEHWQVEAFAEKPWDGKVRAGGEVLVSW